jgi:hypothetical protein
MGFFALAGGALGIPGGFIQGENKRTAVALHAGGNAGDAQLCSLGDRSLAHEIKVPLNPFVVEVADFSDLQVDLDDPGRLPPGGIIEGNFQDTLRYRKLMHGKIPSQSLISRIPDGSGEGFIKPEKSPEFKGSHKMADPKAGMNP